MKKLLLLTLFGGLLSLLSFKESRKSAPEWYTGESKKDSSLLKNESAFTFLFKIYPGNIIIGDVINRDIVFSCNGKTDTIQTNDDGEATLKLKPGNYVFQFYLNENFYEIKTDSIKIKSGYRTSLYVNFTSSITPVISDKPVIYVYPPDTQAVSIRLDLRGEIGFTYPNYDIGWNFTAYPDGSIHMKDKEYHYLFWDGKMAIENDAVNWDEGFIVNRDSLVLFFEEKLKLMGLNSKEIGDYITYWCPRMVANEKNYIHFMFNEDYNEYAELDVNPAPNKMFRVFMLWTKSDGKTNTQVTPQEIETFRREGFTVVEWGGAEMPQLPVIIDAQVSN